MRTLEEVDFAEDRLFGVLRGIALRQREQEAAMGDLVTSQNYTAGAAVQSRLVGLTMAEALIRDELKQLDRIRTAIIETGT